jgi:hypothetical protein
VSVAGVAAPLGAEEVAAALNAMQPNFIDNPNAIKMESGISCKADQSSVSESPYALQPLSNYSCEDSRRC